MCVVVSVLNQCFALLRTMDCLFGLQLSFGVIIYIILLTSKSNESLSRSLSVREKSQIEVTFFPESCPTVLSHGLHVDVQATELQSHSLPQGKTLQVFFISHKRH